MTRGRGRSGRNRIMPGDGKVAGRELQRAPAAAAGEWEPELRGCYPVAVATYLVTGAAGFIGSNFVHYLLSDIDGAEPVALDNLGFAANLANLDPVRDRIRFVEADIADPGVMQTVYQEFEPDYVVNFAAESHNDRAIVDPSSFMRSNALGAQVMLECSRQHPVRTHLHVSTIEVYGELPAGQGYFDESSPLNAKTPYSAAKAAGDQIARAYMQTYPQMDIRMTHCANNYGPYQLPEKLIPLAITNVLRGRKIPVYGDGLQERDWLHVLDHCRAIHAVLTAEVPPVTRAAATRPEPPRTAAHLRHQRPARGHEPDHRQAHPPAPGQRARGVDRARRRPAQPRPPLPHRAGET